MAKTVPNTQAPPHAASPIGGVWHTRWFLLGFYALAVLWGGAIRLPCRAVPAGPGRAVGDPFVPGVVGDRGRPAPETPYPALRQGLVPVAWPGARSGIRHLESRLARSGLGRPECPPLVRHGHSRLACRRAGDLRESLAPCLGAVGIARPCRLTPGGLRSNPPRLVGGSS
jgi:hypothetical protein